MAKKIKSLDHLIASISEINLNLQAQAAKAINVSLTLRNWGIGCYIEVYEREGADRAKYGDQLMDELSKQLQEKKIPRCDRRELYRYRSFYLAYPQIVDAVSPQLQAQFQISKKVDSVSQQSQISGRTLVETFSFTHFRELIEIDDPLKRSFYEIEASKGLWSVRELKRQIASLYFERTGLSTNKAELSELTQIKAEQDNVQSVIRDPYIFDFLGLQSKEIMHESDLENALLDKLQDFLLEMGHGFCFEARQKRILIGEQHYFIDLVFYHRILKCHVLIELKNDRFRHENLGQLNTYVSWFHKNIMAKGDNPPIGLLLCTQKDKALAEYALAGIDNKLFVSKYQIELPKKEELEIFVKQQLE